MAAVCDSAVSQFGGADADDSTVRPGWSIHAVSEVLTHPWFALQLEVGYTERGETREFSFLGVSQETETRLRYLEIPLMARLQVPAVVVAPYIEGGVYLSVLLDADLLYENRSREINDGIHNTDFGLGAGAGLIIDAQVLSVMLGFRFTRGLLPVIDSGEVFAYDSSEPEVYNQSFSIFAGLGF